MNVRWIFQRSLRILGQQNVYDVWSVWKHALFLIRLN
jgi:hypothetical protein